MSATQAYDRLGLIGQNLDYADGLRDPPHRCGRTLSPSQNSRIDASSIASLRQERLSRGI